MKKILLTFYLFAFATIVCAQSNYENQMLENIAKMKSATTVQDFTDLRYTFASMAGNGNDHWQPYYYTALTSLKESEAYVKVGRTELADDGATTALKYLSLIMDKQKNNAEFSVLLGMIHSFKAKLKDSENDRKTAEDYVTSALKLDPKNPRAALLKAELKYTSPADKGGNRLEGIELFKDALKKFNSYKPKTKVDPDWGIETAQHYASFNETALTLLTK